MPFEVNWIAEDWKGLTDLIVGSEMAFKESVLDIIRTVDVVDGRERMLMDLAGGTAYHYLSSAFFGRLRRIEYEVTYVDGSIATQPSMGMTEGCRLLLRANRKHSRWRTSAAWQKHMP